MNVGLVARADDRGLGMVTWEFHRNMQPTRTLVIREPGAEQRGFAPHLDRYPDATVVWFDGERGQLPEGPCRDFLDGLDVVYTVETAYDPAFYEWAREYGVVSVCHVMPEFWRADAPWPDVVWLPTCWRSHHFADVEHVRMVPVPCPTPPHFLPPPPIEGRYVHAVGHRAAMDRNGTAIVARAMRFASSSFTMRIDTQDATVPHYDDPRVTTHTGGHEDRWLLYADAAALVLPRRYGGLCLPALEAMACGRAVVMPGVEPQVSEWPIVAVKSRQAGTLRTPAGTLTLADTDPRDLGRVLDRLASHPTLLAVAQEASSAYADAHSWDALRGMYERELEAAVGCRA